MDLSKEYKNWIYWICGIFTFSWIIISMCYYEKYNDALKGGGDAWGYYIHLPTTFISKDWTSLEYVIQKRHDLKPYSFDNNVNKLGVHELYIAENENPVIKYTCGVALMLSPFFIFAHGISLIFSLPSDGFNSFYFLSVYIGVLFWVLIGSLMLFKVLQRYFNPKISFFSILLILLGTNLYYFIVYNNLMSHAPLFSLYCILIYTTDTFYRRPNLVLSLIIGMTSGLIIMIRPVEIICLFIPLLWNINGLKDRVFFLLKQFKYFILLILGLLIAISPQLIYWKISSGSWIYYSYGNEGFNFLSPQIRKGLFSFQNGWLIYTPIMLFAIMGLFLLFKKNKGIFIPISFYLIIHVFTIYSWHNWYYINSFGSRPMVESYAILAFPFVAFVQYFYHSRGKLLLIIVSIFFILLNQLQVYQISKAILLSEEGSLPYYLSIFGKTKMTEKMLITADTQVKQSSKEKLDSLGVLWSFDIYPSAETSNYILDKTNRIDKSLISDKIKKGDFLKIQVEAKSLNWNTDRWRMATIGISLKNDKKTYLFKWNRINNKLGNPTWNLWGGVPDVWGKAWFFVQVPKKFESKDEVSIWSENTGNALLEIKNFQVELWRMK